MPKVEKTKENPTTRARKEESTKKCLKLEKNGNRSDGVVEYWSTGSNPTLHHSITPTLQFIKWLNVPIAKRHEGVL